MYHLSEFSTRPSTYIQFLLRYLSISTLKTWPGNNLLIILDLDSGFVRNARNPSGVFSTTAQISGFSVACADIAISSAAAPVSKILRILLSLRPPCGLSRTSPEAREVPGSDRTQRSSPCKVLVSVGFFGPGAFAPGRFERRKHPSPTCAGRPWRIWRRHPAPWCQALPARPRPARHLPRHVAS